MLRYSALLFSITLFSCATNSKDRPLETAPPNIIYILADDLGYGDLGCYGQKIIKTPNLDKMAKAGMLFTDHYAGSSVCAPSRAAFMTGFHTGHSYVRGNYETGPYGFGACLELRDRDVTIAEVLKQKGYTSAIIGKWGMGVEGTTGVPNKQGFDYSYGYLNQGHAHIQYPSYLFRNGEQIEIPENRNYANGSFSNDLFTKEAVSFVEKNKDTPFFLYLAYTTPHAEMLLPESSTFEDYKGKAKVPEKPYTQNGPSGASDNNRSPYRSQEFPAAAYAAQITHLDSCVGVMMDQLKAFGLAENTMVIFTSDNGPHSEGGANPAYFGSSGPLRGQKRDLYEGGIRVPFIVKWPARVEAGSRSAHASAFWDMLPTFAAAAGIDSPKTDGLSLLPTLLGQPDKQGDHDYLYWEFHENPTTDQAIRQGNWKAVRHDPAGEIELYDLSGDVGEENNVADRNPETVQKMADLFQTARVPHPLWPLKSAQDAK